MAKREAFYILVEFDGHRSRLVVADRPDSDRPMFGAEHLDGIPAEHPMSQKNRHDAACQSLCEQLAGWLSRRTYRAQQLRLVK